MQSERKKREDKEDKEELSSAFVHKKCTISVRNFLKSPWGRLIFKCVSALSLVVSVIVMIMILRTYNLQKDYYYALISPDIDIDLTVPLVGSKTESGIKFIQEQEGSEKFQIWFKLKNMGEQPFDSVRVGFDYDTKFDKRIVPPGSTFYYLPSRSEQTGGAWVKIPQPTENPKLDFIYTVVYLRTALKLHYRLEKVFGVQWSLGESKEYIVTKIWIEKAVLSRL